jgi:hypothetical protein
MEVGQYKGLRDHKGVIKKKIIRQTGSHHLKQRMEKREKA